ncbi:MAG: hypothetical protein IPH72_13455 [Sandaracinaceae bacterium]|nr:hypothetical protein [Sandaracinaceae bacterium]
MLDTLQAHIDSTRGYEDEFVRLDAIRFDEERDDALLDLAVRGQSVDEGVEWSRWEVRALGVRSYGVQRPWGSISIHDSAHILARCVWEPRRQLYTSARVPDPDATIGRLAVAHAHLAGPWVRLGEYLRGPVGLNSLLMQRVAFLAEGPESFIQAYADVLRDEGAGANVLDGTPTIRWDGQSHGVVEEKPNLFVLTLGDAFFVAGGFEERKRT